MSGIEELFEKEMAVKKEPPATADPPITDPPAPADPTPADPTPPADINKYKVAAELIGADFDDEEKFTAWRTAQDGKIKDYETKEQAWAKEREELTKVVDPMEFFVSKELFVLNGLLKKFPDKNPGTLTQITTQDFSKTYLDNPVDVLALDMMLENPGIYTDKAAAIEDVYAQYNVTDPEDMTPQSKRLMQVNAKKTVEKFNDLRSQIEVPKAVDRTAELAAKKETEAKRIEKLTEATDTLFRKTIPASLKAIEIPVTIKGEDGKEATEIAFTYTVPEGFAKSKAVQDIITSVRNNVLQNEAEWTPQREVQLKEDLTEMLMASYLYKNRTEIYAAIRDDLKTKFADEAWMKRHNVRPLRQDAPPERADPKQAKIEENRRTLAKEMGIKTP